MMDSCIRLNLDLQQTDMQITVRAKRGDTGRLLRITLSNEGVPYWISPDCYGVFTGRKPDNTVIYNQCDIENNEILYRFTEQTCAAPGRIPAEIRLYGTEGKLLTTAALGADQGQAGGRSILHRKGKSPILTGKRLSVITVIDTVAAGRTDGWVYVHILNMVLLPIRGFQNVIDYPHHKLAVIVIQKSGQAFFRSCLHFAVAVNGIQPCPGSDLLRHDKLLLDRLLQRHHASVQRNGNCFKTDYANRALCVGDCVLDAVKLLGLRTRNLQPLATRFRRSSCSCGHSRLAAAACQEDGCK